MGKRTGNEHHELDMSCRGFIEPVATVVGTVAVGPGAGAQAPAGGEAETDREILPAVLDVNGRRHRLLVEPRWTLLYVLRDQLPRARLLTTAEDP